MKTAVNALLGLALLVGPSAQHVAIRPPAPEKILTPNSSTAPKGCKLLASDRGFPADSVWKAAFPKGFKKLKGTLGPDWWIQPTSVEDVQKAVNFAREHNVRLTVISTGHDFHGREYARSGLRVDMASLMEPTVFSNEWKCGDTLKPRSVSGKLVDEVLSCRAKKSKRSSINGRNEEWHFFDKRAGATCASMMRKLKKRHGPEEDGPAAAGEPEAYSFNLPPLAEYVPAYNKITPTGNHAYARIPGGMYNEMLFDQADKSGLMNLGAQHNGVSSLGGWMQAGGHNPFVHKLGMAVDSVVEIEVVTADGKFQKVSECNNPELFWALRGGGGSTFGIVTAITTKVYPTFPIVVARFFVNSTKPEIMDAVSHFLQVGSKLRDQHGLQGYFYVYPAAFQSVLHMPDKFATLENAKQAVEPLMAEMEKIAGAKHIEPKYYQYKTYKEWYLAEMGDEEMEEAGKKFLSWYDGSDGSVPPAPEVMMNPMIILPYALEESQRVYPNDFPKYEKRIRRQESSHADGGHMNGAMAPSQPKTIPRTQPMGRTYLDSRLLSDKMVNSVPLKKLSGVLNATLPRIPGANFRGFLYGGGKQAEPDPDSVGLLPAWRDSTYHFIVNAVPGGARHDYNIGPLAELFPDAGAYVNEASPGEPNWKKVFWGSHYPKLEQIKKKVDPTNVFWCSPCVGADMMTYDDERICPNPKYPQAGPPPQTYANPKSTRGIASLPGQPGIANPLMPIIQDYMVNKKLPKTMPGASFFKMAMGEGGARGGSYANVIPKYDQPAAAASPPAAGAASPPAASAPGPAAAPPAPAKGSGVN